MPRTPRVVASQALPWGALDALAERVDLEVVSARGAPTPETLRARVAEADGLLCLLTDRVDAPLLAAAPALRVVSTVSVGVDHIDVAAAHARGIAVGHTPGVLAETTADLAFALLLAAARRVAEGDRVMRGGGWRPERVWAPDMLVGPDVHGATLGLLGLGAIAQAVARRARGFGMRVIAWNRSPRVVEGVECLPFEAVLEASDFLSIHVARGAETIGLLGRAELARMPRHAILINTARGGIVDELALAEALEAGALAGAGLDVFEDEPLPADHPLLRAPGTTLTPHIGSASRATRGRMIALALDNLDAGLRGEPLPHAVSV